MDGTVEVLFGGVDKADFSSEKVELMRPEDGFWRIFISGLSVCCIGRRRWLPHAMLISSEGLSTVVNSGVYNLRGGRKPEILRRGGDGETGCGRAEAGEPLRGIKRKPTESFGRLHFHQKLTLKYLLYERPP